MVTLDGVDADAVETGQVEALYFLSYHGNLVAVRYDDADGLVGIERLAVEPVDAAQQVGNDMRLTGIDLVGDLGLTAVG